MRAVAVGALLSVTLAGCLTTENYTVTASDAVKTLPQACAYRATFPVGIHFAERPVPAALGDTQAALLTGYADGRTYEMGCVCKERMNPAMLNKATGDKFISDALDGRAAPKNVRYSLNSDPKFIEYDYEGMGFGGSVAGSGKMIATERCVENFMITARTVGDPEYATFITAIHPASQVARGPDPRTAE